MKVLFLDFDGVLNSSGFFLLQKRKQIEVHGTSPESMICPMAASNLQFILDNVLDLKIVISSTWREVFTIEEIKKALDYHGVDSSRVIGKTDLYPKERMGSTQRGDLIKKWVDDNKVECFAVVDDDDDMDAVETNFFKTSYNDGLTFKIATKIGYHLGARVLSFY